MREEYSLKGGREPPFYFSHMKPRNLNSLWMLAAGLFFACMGALVKLGAQKFSSAELVFYHTT